MNDTETTEKMTNEQLVVRIQAGEDTADNMLALWKQNSGFINMVAAKFSVYTEIEDLRQEGYIGLCEAVRHYNIESGVPFINYATFWIKQVMRRYVENCGSIVRIPSHMSESVRKYKKICSEYKKNYGCEPSDREIRELLLVSDEKLKKIKRAAEMGQIQSSDEPIKGVEDGLCVADTIADKYDLAEDVEERLDFQNMQEELWKVVDSLPGQQAVIIRKRYLDDKTMEETAADINSTLGRVGHEQKKAFKAMKRSHNLQVYFEVHLSAAPIHHVGVENFKRTWTSEVERAALGLRY